jgi:diguanylate cyclase (GGDEF)-like protein
MSGRVDPGDVDAGLGAGAHDVLRKPFEPLDLLARVGAAMRTRRLQHELRALGAELERQATTDSLTGLANRRFLDGQLDRLSARSARHGRELAVLLLDIDGFRSLNDAHGHEAGDAALAQIGRRLLNRCRREDIVGRWGGEEFLVVAPDIGAQGAWVLAEALRTAVSGEPLVVAGRTVAVTASIGWSTWRADGDSAGALVHRADRALYAAKSAGRDAVRGETA